jgi:uncharacterized protein Veg
LRKIVHELELVKTKIKELVGKNVKMKVNKGRKKIIRFNATIDQVYSSVFIVRLDRPTTVETLSYSYFDVLCGDVKLCMRDA